MKYIDKMYFANYIEVEKIEKDNDFRAYLMKNSLLNKLGNHE